LPHEVAGNKLMVLLAFGGLVSGLLTSVLMAPGQQEAGLYCGAVFGSFLAVPLVISRILDAGILYSFLKALGLIVVSTAAYLFAYLTAFGVQLNFPQIVPNAERWDMGTAEPASPIALFVGGLVGGFLVFGAVMFFSPPEIGKGTRVRKVIQGALLGGVLGVAAWALRSSVGVALWNLFHAFGLTPRWELSPRMWFHGVYDYGGTARMYSLYVVWQTGVATAVGIMLRHTPVRGEYESNDLRLKF